jgi:hypothetical protein
MKLGNKQQMALREIAQAGEAWRYASDWHSLVVKALERRGLVEVRSLADGGWTWPMVRATPVGQEVARAS